MINKIMTMGKWRKGFSEGGSESAMTTITGSENKLAKKIKQRILNQKRTSRPGAFKKTTKRKKEENVTKKKRNNATYM